MYCCKKPEFAFQHLDQDSPSGFHNYVEGRAETFREHPFGPKVLLRQPTWKEPEKGISIEDEIALFRHLDSIVVKGLKGGLDAGMAMMTIRDRKLWKAAGYANWNQYCEEVKGLTRQYANRLIKSARTLNNLKQVETIVSTSLKCLPQNEAQVKELYPLKDPEKQAKAWLLAAERSQGRPTAKSLSMVVAELMAKEDVPAKVIKPNRKTQLALKFEQLRAVASAVPQPDELLGLIEEIQKLAK